MLLHREPASSAVPRLQEPAVQTKSMDHETHHSPFETLNSLRAARFAALIFLWTQSSYSL